MNDRSNTIFGWVLFALGLGLGLSILSGKFFHANKPERPEIMGYAIEGVVEDGESADSGPSLAMLLAGADAAAGEQAATARCGTCHSFNSGGPAGTGPNLYGVVGSKIGAHAPGFAYSSALKEKGGEWTYENMNLWLTSPRKFANGTKMSFAGLSKGEDRANIIAYLKEMGGGPAFPVPEAPAAEGEAGAEPAIINDADGLAEPAAMEAEAMANQPAAAGVSNTPG